MDQVGRFRFLGGFFEGGGIFSGRSVGSAAGGCAHAHGGAAVADGGMVLFNPQLWWTMDGGS